MSDIEKAKEHIKNLANDYKCYDNTISFEEALALNEALQNPCKICDYFADDNISYCRKSESTRLQNQDLRKLIREKNIYLWQVADEIGIAESTLLRWLRYPLDDEKRKLFLEAVKRIEGR